MVSEVAVVIPFYRNELTITERVSLNQCRKVLGKYPICFVIPYSLKIDIRIIYETDKVVSVPDEWMGSLDAYNYMMLNVNFYRLFKKYKYILIYQLDAYVFSDRLLEFCLLEYDYIGAPWIEGKFDVEHEENGVIYVGNGGFSLRRVDACVKVLTEYCGKSINYNEDLFWGAQKSIKFQVAPVDIAIDFAFERPVGLLFEKNNYCLPFGCHAWMKYDFNFFKPYLISNGYKELKDYKPKYTYDLQNRYIDQNYVYANKKVIWDAIVYLTQLSPKIIYIYGASKKGKLCGYLLKKLNGLDIQYLDKDELKWNMKIYEFPVLSPYKIQQLSNNTIIIVTVNKYTKVIEELTERGFQRMKNIIIWDQLVDTINFFMLKNNDTI